MTFWDGETELRAFLWRRVSEQTGWPIPGQISEEETTVYLQVSVIPVHYIHVCIHTPHTYTA